MVLALPGKEYENMTSQYESELTIAISAVKTAATLCRNVQSAIDDAVLSKDDRSPVTIADFASQAIVCRALEEHFPNDPMIAEEDSAALGEPENAHLLERIQRELNAVHIKADHNEIRTWIDRGNAQSYSDRFWTLDPIDGTKGFLRGQQYAIALALIIKGKIEVALLGCPNLSQQGTETRSSGHLFYAIRNEGAFMLSLDTDSEPERISVSTTATSSAARFM